VFITKQIAVCFTLHTASHSCYFATLTLWTYKIRRRGVRTKLHSHTDKIPLCHGLFLFCNFKVDQKI